MKKKSRLRSIASLTVAGVAALGLYAYVVRPRHLRWGATEEELGRSMPLDDEVELPDYVTNRAITINTPPGEVWPWLAQMGELPRGGFYSYLTVERALGMEVENAEEILPQFQHLETGDKLDRKGDMVVKSVEPERWLVLGPPKHVEFKSTWAIALFPVEPGRTRVLSRVRARLPRSAAGLAMFLILDPGQFIMERK